MSAAVPASADKGVAQAFSPRTVLVIALVGVFTFAASVVLTAYAPELRGRGNGGAHALSQSATGYAGLVDLARMRGLQVDIGSDRGNMPRERLRILTPEPYGPALGEKITPEPRETVVVILPKWITAPHPLHRGWVQRVGAIPAGDVDGLLGESRRPTLTQDKGAAPLRLVPNPVPSFELAAPAVDAGEVENLRTLSGDRYDPLLKDGRGRTLIGQGTDSGIVVVADPDLFNTQGLHNRERARMAVAVLEQLAGGRPLVFDVSANGFGASRNVLKLAFEPPFLAATLCAVAAAALIGWHAAARFGAPKPGGRAIALGKTALADNSAALLHLAGREPHMAAPYAELTLQAAARAVGVPRGLEPAEQAALLDRLSLQAGAAEPASQLQAEARGVRDMAGLLRVARKLRAFRRVMTREA